jgi:L-ascorbate metabolism protein UlaG (beta-lactamase superfamily)
MLFIRRECKVKWILVFAVALIMLMSCTMSQAQGMPTPVSTSYVELGYKTVTPSPIVVYSTNCAVNVAKPERSLESGPVTVTYLANAGFLITGGRKKILIDGLPEKSILEAALLPETAQAILTAQPPFDDIDLILVTHSHWDHFSVENVVSHMKNDVHAVLVSTAEVVDAIIAVDKNFETRLVPIQLQRRECKHIMVNDIDLQALSLSHGRGMSPVENLGFIITLDDVMLFHTGDMDPDAVPLSTLQTYGIPELGADIAFLPEYMLTAEVYHKHITEGIHADHLIPMHFTVPPSSEIPDVFPNAIIFRTGMEDWMLR